MAGNIISVAPAQLKPYNFKDIPSVRVTWNQLYAHIRFKSVQFVIYLKRCGQPFLPSSPFLPAYTPFIRVMNAFEKVFAEISRSMIAYYRWVRLLRVNALSRSRPRPVIRPLIPTQSTNHTSTAGNSRRIPEARSLDAVGRPPTASTNEYGTFQAHHHAEPDSCPSRGRDIDLES